MVTGLGKTTMFYQACLHTKIALSMEEYAFYRCAMCMNQVYFRKKREKSKKRVDKRQREVVLYQSRQREPLRPTKSGKKN